MRAYEAAGVDAIFLVGVTSRDQLERIAAAVTLPIILGGARPELADLDYLGRLGVRLCLQGHKAFLAAVGAVHDALKALRAGTLPAEIEGATAEMIKEVTREQDYRRRIKDFLGGD